jgi:hypothetical protein
MRRMPLHPQPVRHRHAARRLPPVDSRRTAALCRDRPRGGAKRLRQCDDPRRCAREPQAHAPRPGAGRLPLRPKQTGLPALAPAQFLVDAVALAGAPKLPPRTFEERAAVAHGSLHPPRKTAPLSTDAIMFLKMLLVLGLVLGFGFWELVEAETGQEEIVWVPLSSCPDDLIRASFSCGARPHSS